MTGETSDLRGTRALVVGMSGSTGLAVARALAAAGVSVRAVHHDIATPACATRLASCRRCPDWRAEPERFLEALIETGRALVAAGGAGGGGDTPGDTSDSSERHASASLFVADDAALDVVWRARGPLRDAGLAPAFSFVRPPAEVVDKREQAQAARRAGVDIPWTEWGAAGELAGRADDFAYPLLVKPAVSHAGVKAIGAKAIVCAAPAELRAALDRTGDLDVMTQDFVPGGDDRLYTAGVFRGGRRTVAFTGRKLKQHPPTLGISRLSEAIEVPEIVAGSVRLLDELGYEGIAQVEYKRDERDGVFRLMEVNFRPWTWIGLATACGVPLVAAAHEWALGVGESGAGDAAAGREGGGAGAGALSQRGGRWIWVMPEAIHTLRDLSHGQRPPLSQWRHIRAEAFFARNDPRPFVVALTAPFDRRLTAAKRLANRLARPPAFALNAVVLRRLARRERSEPPIVGLPPGDRVLVLAPHPDDETIMCGATLAASRRRGDAVRIVAVTSGGATEVISGQGAGGGDDVAATREDELRRAVAELGVDDIGFLGLADRGLTDARGRLAERLAAVLAGFAPTDVYVPFPYDVHPDHVATSLALADALGALDRAAAGNGGGPVSPTVHCGFIQTPASPGWVTRVVPVGGDGAAKRRAVAAHASRDRAIFAKPLQLAWFNPGAYLRRSEAFVDLRAPAYVALCRDLEREELTRPAIRSPWHPLLASYEFERTRGQRAHVAAALRAAATA